MNAISLVVDAVKAPVRRRIESGNMIAIVRELLSRGEMRRLADNLVAFDHEPRAVAVHHHPFAPEEGDRSIRGVVNGDEINKRVRLVGRQASAAVMVAQLVEASRKAGEFA